MDNDEDQDNKELCDPFFAHCKAHADKDMAKRKVNSLAEQCAGHVTTWMNSQRRDFLTVIKKHKGFQYDESDERVSLMKG